MLIAETLYSEVPEIFVLKRYSCITRKLYYVINFFRKSAAPYCLQGWAYEIKNYSNYFSLCIQKASKLNFSLGCGLQGPPEQAECLGFQQTLYLVSEVLEISPTFLSRSFRLGWQNLLHISGYGRFRTDCGFAKLPVQIQIISSVALFKQLYLFFYSFRLRLL